MKRAHYTVSATLAFILALGACASEPTTVQRPENLPENINAPMLADGPVEPWVARWEGESREVFKYRHRIVAALGLRRGDRVADVGCGTGPFESILSKAAGPLGWVYALDIAPKFVAYVTKRVEKEGLQNVEVRQSEQNDIGLPTASIDLAFICDVYHHFEEPPVILASIRRALKPHGRLAIVEFDRIDGKSSPFILKHVRAGKEVFRSEIEAAGFRFVRDVPVDGLRDNYLLLFSRD